MPKRPRSCAKILGKPFSGGTKNDLHRQVEKSAIGPPPRSNRTRAIFRCPLTGFRGGIKGRISGFSADTRRKMPCSQARSSSALAAKHHIRPAASAILVADCGLNDVTASRSCAATRKSPSSPRHSGAPPVAWRQLANDQTAIAVQYGVGGKGP